MDSLYDESTQELLIDYLEENPESLLFSHYADRFYFTVSGRSSGQSTGLFGRESFIFQIEITEKGRVKNICGIIPEIDVKPLELAIKKAMKNSFKLRKKKKAVGAT